MFPLPILIILLFACLAVDVVRATEEDLTKDDIQELKKTCPYENTKLY